MIKISWSIGRNVIFDEMPLNKTNEKTFLMNPITFPQKSAILEDASKLRFYSMLNYLNDLGHLDYISNIVSVLNVCKFGE